MKSPSIGLSQNNENNQPLQKASTSNMKSPKQELNQNFFNFPADDPKKEYKRSDSQHFKLISGSKHRKQKSLRIASKPQKPSMELTRLEGFGLNDDMADKEFPKADQMSQLPLG